MDWRTQEKLRNEAQLRTEATITNGVIRWNSNGQVPPDDLVALAVEIGLPVDAAATKAAGDADFKAFMADYRKARRNRTAEVIAEERAEARAAHGPGVKLVNIVTGEKWTT